MIKYLFKGWYISRQWVQPPTFKIQCFYHKAARFNQTFIFRYNFITYNNAAEYLFMMILRWGSIVGDGRAYSAMNTYATTLKN